MACAWSTPERSHASHRDGTCRLPAVRPRVSRHPSHGRNVPVRFGPSRDGAGSPHPGTMASADSPPSCPGGVSPGKNALLPGTAAAFTSATEPNGFAVLCQLTASRRPYYAILVHRPAGFP